MDCDAYTAAAPPPFQNLEYARALLTKLEHEALAVKVHTRRQEMQADLNRKRDLFDRLAERLRELEASNADANAQAEALRTDAMIESIAREDYGLARPGDELYHVLETPQDPVKVPDAWPFNGLGTTLDR